MQNKFDELVYRIGKYWDRLVFRSFGSGNISRWLRMYIGPFAALSGVMLLFCIIFYAVYRNGKRIFSFILTILSGVLSVICATLWRVTWLDDYYWEKAVTWVPVVLVAGIVIWILVRCFIMIEEDAEKKREEKAERKREERPQMLLEKMSEVERKKQESGTENADRNAKIFEAREAVSAGAQQLVSQVKESTAVMTDAAKKIIADGNNPVGVMRQNVIQGVRMPIVPENIPVGTCVDTYALEKIRGLYGLLKSGFITHEEFEGKKKELLERL